MKQYVQRFLEHPYFDDRLLLGLFTAVGVVTVASLIMQLIGIESVAFQLPVQYSDFEPFITNGDWWQLLKFPLFAVASSAINLLVAVRLFRLDRLISLYVTVAALVISILMAVVSWAVLGLI